MNEARSSYLIVRLAEQLLALPVAQTVEVCRVPSLRPSRGEAPGLLGMAVLRGELTAVLDLRALLGWTAGTEDERVSGGDSAQSRLVTVRTSRVDETGFIVALLVDEVIGVREVATDRVSAIALPGDRTQQMGAFDEEFARLLDASGLVAPDAWEQIAEAAQIGEAAE